MDDGILGLLGALPPPIKIVDVGAMDVGVTAYDALLELPGATVVGFEPNPEECAKLNAAAPASHQYHPHFVGDGTKRTFRWTSWAPTASLYVPNEAVLRRFTDLGDVCQVVREEEVQTTRLDDIAAARGADFIKIDAQGASLDIIRGGPETIGRALVVQCEVEFVPVYRDEPLFAEVDQAMRKLGFLFHQFRDPTTMAFAPLRRRGDARSEAQLLWADAVYVRSFVDLAGLEPDELLKLALIVARLCQSYDFALLALQHHDDKTGGALWDRYVKLLTGKVKEKPPL
jgi:FkbM family methyltransferase